LTFFSSLKQAVHVGVEMKADTKEIGPQKVVRVSIYRTWQVNSILSTTWELSFGASKNCQNSSLPTIQNVMDELSKSSYS
jgi:hypothetical protein